MHFIRLISQGPGHAFFNMSLDEAIAEAVRERRSPPTLRFYQWDRPSVSIGYFQKASDVNLDHCARKGYPLVRRLTGGRAILHDEELTYSISSFADPVFFKERLIETYTVISNALLRGLQLNGIDARISCRKKRGAHYRDPSCFRSMSYGEITVNRKKIIGSAQKRYANGFLQHGSLLFGFNADELCNTLRGTGPDDRARIGSIRECGPGITPELLRRSLKEAFEKELNVKLVTDDPTKDELKAADRLVKTKYSTDAWNLMR
jgi:lipoate-protein ligase A